jgi:hypothetical protein
MPLDSEDLQKIEQLIRRVVRDELMIEPVELAKRWAGGKIEIWPRDSALGAKEIPLDSFFRKIIMVRDRLRVLEQQINGHASLSDEEKLHLQQYVTRCYGSLTTFNVLFKDKEDHFVGQKED